MLLSSIPILALAFVASSAPQPLPIAPQIVVADLTSFDLVVASVRARPPAGLQDAERYALGRVVGALRAGDQALAAKRWSTFVTQIATNDGAIDPNALVQHVLRESYLQNTEDLRFFADKVKYFNECKKAVRDYVQKLRDYDAAGKAGMSWEVTPLQLNEKYSLFAAATIQTAARTMSKAEIAAEIEKWEAKVAKLDEISKTAIADLHKALERHEEVVALMAKIAKQYHATAIAIVANTKG